MKRRGRLHQEHANARDSRYFHSRHLPSLDQGHQGLVYSLSLLGHVLCRTEDCRRPLRAHRSDAGPRQRCLGTHSDSPRSPGCGDFNGINHRLDQGPPPVMPRDFEICQGHPMSVSQGSQACSIGSTTFIPRQGIFYRWDM